MNRPGITERGFGILAVGVAGIVAGAPMAGAQPPPDPECTPQQVAGQQCEQQQQPNMPEFPELPKNPNDAATQPTPPQQPPPPSPQQQPPPQQGDLADKNCWVVNGVPRWNAPGTAPAPTGPGDIVEWCPAKYGLTPH